MRPSLGIPGFMKKNLAGVLVVLVIIVVFVGWKINVSLNDDGLIIGSVVDTNGTPIADATVHIQEKTINLLKPPVVAVTGADGRFEYQDMAIIEFVIRAMADGYGVSEPRRYHLYFKRQNFEIRESLVLTPVTESAE